MYLPAIVSVSMYFEKKRALATGIAVCGSGIGTSLFAPLLHYLINNYGWNNTIVIMGAIVLLCVSLCALFKPVPSDDSAGNNEVEAKDKNILTESTFDEDISFKRCQSIGFSCHTLPANILGKVINVNLIYNGIFNMFALCALLANIGIYVPYVYTVVREQINR